MAHTIKRKPRQLRLAVRCTFCSRISCVCGVKLVVCVIVHIELYPMLNYLVRPLELARSNERRLRPKKRKILSFYVVEESVSDLRKSLLLPQPVIDVIKKHHKLIPAVVNAPGRCEIGCNKSTCSKSTCSVAELK